MHDNITKFIENFHIKTNEIKETKRIFDVLHVIDREYDALHTSHPKISTFDWKTRFGLEVTDMFNYNPRLPDLKLKPVE